MGIWKEGVLENENKIWKDLCGVGGMIDQYQSLKYEARMEQHKCRAPTLLLSLRVRIYRAPFFYGSLKVRACERHYKCMNMFKMLK